MSNEVSESRTSVTTTGDGFGVSENRSNASPIIGKMVKFTNDGRFVIDKTTQLPTDTTLVAVGVWTGWVHWDDGQPIEHLETREGESHPDNEDLPDRDKSLWPPSRFTGLPDDPWKDTRYTHLIDPQTGMDYTLVGDTFGMRKGVGELKSQIRNVRTACPTAFPIVQLRAGIMPTKLFGPKPYPQFVVVGWRGRQQETIAAAPTVASAREPVKAIEPYRPKDDSISTGRPKPKDEKPKDDMDGDSIPF
jgi:hypothetical protein